jgi:CRP/FNR family cyclic AMP-dependent transcriptional regulator
MVEARNVLRALRREALPGGFLLELPPAEAGLLLSESVRMDVPAGAVIYRAGDPARCFVVVRGLLRSYVGSPDGRQIVFRYGKMGDVMGLATVLGEPEPVTIQALSPSSVLTVRVDALRHMVSTDPLVAEACAREITRQLDHAINAIAETAFNSVRQRLTRQLLDVASQPDTSDPHLVARVSHQELADAIASSREVVTRTLRRMQREGLVRTGERVVVLLDVDRLADEVEARPARSGERGRTGLAAGRPSGS